MDQDANGSQSPLPDTGRSEDQKLVVPFEDQGKDFFSGLIETIKLVLFQPTYFFKQYKLDGTIGRPILFAVIVGWVAAIVDIIWNLAMNRSIFSFLRERLPELQEHFPDIEGFDFDQIGSGWAMESFQSVMGFILAPLMILVVLFISAGLYHLFLMIVKGNNKSFETTINVVAYGTAASLFKILPFCGGLLSWIYGIVLAIIGITETHKTDSWKAVLAVLGPMVLCCLCCVLAFFAIASTGFLASMGS